MKEWRGGRDRERERQLYFVDDSSPNVFCTATVNLTWKERYMHVAL